MNMLQSSDQRMKSMKENTILSFNAAARHPLDFIEFDVQVSLNLFLRRIIFFLFFFFLFSWGGGGLVAAKWHPTEPRLFRGSIACDFSSVLSQIYWIHVSGQLIRVL